MKLATLYRAARRNVWRYFYRDPETRYAWKGIMNYPHAKERWAHTELARKRLAGYMAEMRHRLVTVAEFNKVLAAHWLEFKPRTRCISRMLRDLLAPKDRYVLKSA